MKVTPPTHATEQPPANPANKVATRRTVSNSTAPPTHEDAVESAANSAYTRDFASVLEDVTRAEESRDEGESGEGDDRTETKPSQQADRERETKRREDRDTGSNAGGGFDARGQVRDASQVADAAPARAILHIADLERIVAAVRTQLLNSGRQEVTLELQRSVLEGLRVRLTTDTEGRVHAEFIAATEKVRAQLDARAADLSDLLRSRGVELAAFRTTLVSDGNQTASGDERGRHAHDSAPPLAAVGGTEAAPFASVSEADAGDGYAGDESTSSYRA
ncbi:MAG TPA: flagellar hook-length control protein FliK [Pyrinomonadaceae bacterium]|nr:flagellar hook-length control protein FliK [Pyrinomonadaceae bacterium]